MDNESGYPIAFTYLRKGGLRVGTPVVRRLPNEDFLINVPPQVDTPA